MKKIILILSSILLLASCEKHYYDPVVQIKEYEGLIPQEGEVIMIDFIIVINRNLCVTNDISLASINCNSTSL